MKIDCGPTSAEKFAASKEWHPVFLLWPKRFGSHDCRWFETVDRRWKFDTDNPLIRGIYALHGFPNGHWEYRVMGDAA